MNEGGGWREGERERKEVISHPCSMQRKYNFHLSSTAKNIKKIHSWD